MKLLQHFKELTVRPKNAQELKGLIVKLALQGKLTKNWRSKNTSLETGSDLLNNIKINFEKNFDKLSKRDAETKTEVLKSFAKIGKPNNWAICALHDLANFWNGKAHEKGVQEDGDYFLVNSRFVSTNGIRYKRTNLALSPLKVNDIAIVMSDVPNGRALARCFHVKEENKYTLNQRIGGITLFDGINPEFIVLVLDRNQHYLDINDGKKQSNLKRIQMISCPIALPPLEEQKEIVSVIETLFKEVEQLEQLTKERIQLKKDFVASALHQLTTNTTQNEWAFLQKHFKSFFTETTNIKKLRETVLQLAVKGKLTADWRKQRTLSGAEVEDASQLLKRIQKEKAQLIKDKKIKKEKPLPSITKDEIPYELPEGWVWCRLQDLVNVGTGSTPAKSNSTYYDGTIPWYTSSATNDLFAKESEKLITEKALKETNCKVFPKGTLIIAMYGQGKTRGQISELVIPGATNQAIAAMVFYENSLGFKDYIKYFFRKIYQEIRLLAEGGAQPNLNVGKIKNTILPLPSLAEQKAIVEKVNALMDLCDRLEQEVQQSQEQSEKLMQSCLREVFEGESKTKTA